MVNTGMDDGASANTVRATTVFMNANSINVIDVPAMSPDLNVKIYGIN